MNTKEDNLKSMKRKISKIFGVGLAVMLLASLLLVAVPVSAVVGQSTVTLTTNTISTAGDYSIKFDSYFPLAVGATISVKFPSGTTGTSFAATNVNITTSGGTAATVGDTYNTTTRVWVGTIVAGNVTTAASSVTVAFATAAGIVNPGTPGDYTLEVKTSVETTYVVSKTYAVSIPGMIMRYNKDGNFVGTYSSIQAALTATNEKDVIKIGEGTYTAAITGMIQDYITVEGTGEAADTIIKAAVAIDKNFAIFDNVTLKGVVTVTGTDASIIDSILTKKATSGETLVISTGTRLKVTDCTIDTTYKSVQDTAISVNGGNDSTIDGCTFTTDDGDATNQDMAIVVTAAVTGLTVKNSTFNGTKGIGYKDEAGAVITTSTVKDNTFDGFQEAFSISNTGATSKLTIQGNTITNQTKSTVGAIDIDTALNVIIVGNTIQDSVGYSIHIAANQDKVTVIGNNFVDNAKGFKNAVTTKMSIINNWWGDVSGPAGEGTGTGDAVSTYATYKPFLTASSSAGQSGATATSLDAKTVAGVKVSGLATAATLIYASSYTGNPKDVSPKYDALAGAWFDVYINGGTAPTGGITLKFYADDVTKDTDAYVWSGLESKWVKCSDQGASSSGGYVWVTVKTAATTPVYGDLSELPFVLLDAPVAAPTTFSLTSPEAGATDMPLTNVPFTWSSVTDAVDYFLRVSENADLSKPFIAEVCAGTAYTLTEALTDGTPYYWQVTARDADGDTKAESDVSTFIAKEAVEAVVPEVTVEVEAPAAPEVTVEVAAPPAPEVTVEAPAAEAAVTPAYIWAIIAIGAVLVIAVIVLIVRTRRVV